MYIYDLGTRQTESLSMSQMNDMITMLMFTIEHTSSLVNIGLSVVVLDHVSLKNYEGS
jgi:hypothetical protein